MSDFEPGEGWEELDLTVSAYGRLHIYEFDGSGAALRKWVAVPPVLPLPTEPGYYVASEPGFGDTVVVELLNRPVGQWVDAGDRNYLQADDVRVLGPLVRLEPRAVTAEVIADWFAREAEFGSDDWRNRASSTIRREFGVAS